MKTRLFFIVVAVLAAQVAFAAEDMAWSWSANNDGIGSKATELQSSNDQYGNSYWELYQKDETSLSIDQSLYGAAAAAPPILPPPPPDDGNALPLGDGIVFMLVLSGGYLLWKNHKLKQEKV